MAKSRKRKAVSEVLCWSNKPASRGTVWLHYLAWRAAQNPPLPVRCDRSQCEFHASPLKWNGNPLKPILDHLCGDRNDNRPERLRLLCPNCDSQQPTRGGANKLRIEEWRGGTSARRACKSNYTMYPMHSGEAKPGAPQTTARPTHTISELSDTISPDLNSITQ